MVFFLFFLSLYTHSRFECSTRNSFDGVYMCSSVIVCSFATPHPNSLHYFFFASLTRTGAGSSPWCRFCARTLTTRRRRSRHCVGIFFGKVGRVHDSRSREGRPGLKHVLAWQGNTFFLKLVWQDSSSLTLPGALPPIPMPFHSHHVLRCAGAQVFSVLQSLQAEVPRPLALH